MLRVNSRVRVRVAADAAVEAAFPAALLEPDFPDVDFLPPRELLTALPTLRATLAVTAVTTAPKILLPRLFFRRFASSFSALAASFSAAAASRAACSSSAASAASFAACSDWASRTSKALSRSMACS